ARVVHERAAVVVDDARAGAVGERRAAGPRAGGDVVDTRVLDVGRDGLQARLHVGLSHRARAQQRDRRCGEGGTKHYVLLKMVSVGNLVLGSSPPALPDEPTASLRTRLLERSSWRHPGLGRGRIRPGSVRTGYAKIYHGPVRRNRRLDASGVRVSIPDPRCRTPAAPPPSS